MVISFYLIVAQGDGEEAVVVVDGWHRVTAMKLLYQEHPELIGTESYTAVGYRLRDDLPYNVAIHIASGVSAVGSLLCFPR